MQRTIIVIPALLASLALVAPAAAEPAQITLSGGLGVKAIGLTQCPPGEPDTFACPNATSHSIVGAAPVAALAYIKKTTPKRGLALRFGPEITASIVGSPSQRGVSIGGMMTVGLHFHMLFVETGGGISALSLDSDEASGRAGTFFVHYGAGIELSPQLALTARADAHVMMHGPMAAGVVAAGLTYTPSM